MDTMTMQELITMTGSQDQADFALHILLKHVKPAMIHAAVKAELDTINREIKALEAEGYIYTCNGMQHVCWRKAEELNRWEFTPEQQAAYDAACAKCSRAEYLLYLRNRTTDLIAYRG